MKDFLIDTDSDIKISSNDLAIGYSDQQHREHLLLTEKGAIKQYPDAGVGAYKFLESEEPALLLREINIQFSADGMNVKKAQIDSTGKLIIEAPYK